MLVHDVDERSQKLRHVLLELVDVLVIEAPILTDLILSLVRLIDDELKATMYTFFIRVCVQKIYLDIRQCVYLFKKNIQRYFMPILHSE